MHNILLKDPGGIELSKRLLDALIVVIAAHAAAFFYFGKSVEQQETAYPVIVYFGAGMVFYLFPKFQLYASWRGRPMLLMFAYLALAWALIVLSGVFFSYMLHLSARLSRLWMTYWFATGAVLLIFHRLAIYTVLRWMRRQGRNGKKVVLVGYGEVGREMHRRALKQDWFGYEIKAIHCSAEEQRHITDSKISRIERLEEIDDFVTRHDVHEVWLTLPVVEYDKLQKLQYLLRNALCDIRWMPDAPSISMISRRSIDFLGMLTVDLNRPESHGVRGIAKDLFDKVFALTVLAALALPFLVIAACIKYSSSGPVFFRQTRHGLNGKKFLIYKFRTMKLHVEHQAVTQATQNDPRVTWIGGFLRRTSIDELPQFINVLKGDMSVVGPRPHALEHNDFYKDELEVYMLRHRVKPGITGWAQINGLRGETDTLDKMEKRVQFDMQYIKQWSLWLDLKIIFWTALKGWTGKNVY
jgi:putative colanic acid biosynthesis UDP-glucose lipid carrier transferase